MNEWRKEIIFIELDQSLWKDMVFVVIIIVVYGQLSSVYFIFVQLLK